jgi:autotransporter strand-loop-strand O-heptosyltransferase
MVKRSYSKEELVQYNELEPNCKDLKDKTILLHFDSFCLGDSICFAAFIDHFIEHHQPRYVYITTFLRHIFESNNDRVEFISATDISRSLTIDKLINVGYDKNDLQHTMGGMFYATKDTMLIPQNLKPGKVPVIPKQRNVIRNKITIAPETLKKIAEWDKDKWQNLVNILVNNGFEVYNVSYEDRMKLDNVVDVHGFDDINVSLGHILDSRLFIGLSSGLAWLAWSYNVPVVMISGFTKKHNEFDCYRVMSESGCSGCFNIFKNIKTTCPIFKDTDRSNECSKLITVDMVIEQINKALSEN